MSGRCSGRPVKRPYPTGNRRPYYPPLQRTTDKLINAGVALGTVAIGASVLTGIVGSLKK